MHCFSLLSSRSDSDVSTEGIFVCMRGRRDQTHEGLDGRPRHRVQVLISRVSNELMLILTVPGLSVQNRLRCAAAVIADAERPSHGLINIFLDALLSLLGLLYAYRSRIVPDVSFAMLAGGSWE